MKEIIPNLLEEFGELVTVVQFSDLKVIHASPALRRMIHVNSGPSADVNLRNVLDFEISDQQVQEIQHDVTTHGFAALRKGSDRYDMFFMLMPVGENKCIVRIQPKKGQSTFQRYKDLIENNVAGIFQSTIDSVLLDCNQSFASMLGYDSRDELIGKSTKPLYFEIVDREAFLSDLRKQIKLANYPIVLRKKDGTPIECLENTYLTKDEDGEEVINGTIIDITPLKEAERALAESEHRFAALANASHEAVIFVQDEVIVDCNDQFPTLFGYTRRSDVITSSLSEYINSADISRLFMAMDISSANRTELRAVTRDGKSLILEVSGTFLKYRNHMVRVFVFADVTVKKKSEYTLEQTIMRLKNVLENAPNAIFITIDGTIRYTNQSGLNLFQVEDEEDLLDRSIVELICAEFREEIAADFELVAQGGEQEYKEIKVIAGESAVDVGIQSTLTVFENQPAIQISMTDISERMALRSEQIRLQIVQEINVALKSEIEEHKATQQKLREQEQYTRNLIESSLDMIVACDTEFKLTEFNKSAQSQFGFLREEVMGKHMKTLCANAEQCDLMHSELTRRGEFFGEVTNQRRSGEKFQSLVSFSVMRDGSGKGLGYMAIFRDITEYRANERRALEQKAKLESIFNSTENMLMWTMDRQFRLSTSNKNFENWTKENLSEPVGLGDNVLQVLECITDPNLYQGQLSGFVNAFSGRPQQFELAVLNRDNNQMWLQFFINPVYLDNEQEEVSCLVYDTTDRKSIEHKIREALKEKEVLLQEIHHRVKNNLQVISSILNLQSSYVSDKRILEVLQESQNRIKSMSFIHETLYRTTDFSSINFSEYLRTLANNLIQTYSLRGHAVTFRPELEDITVHIDQAIPCGLIVNELISNALKYAYTGRDSGNLDLSIHEESGRLHLRVADDGVGVPEGFDFEKVDSLGIQLVYTLTEQLDGDIKVNSSPGKGTEIIITFELIKNKD